MTVTKNLFYILEATADGCIAEFYINDFPICRRGKACGYYYGGPVNEFLLKGVNTLSFIIQPGKTPRGALSGETGERQRQVPEENAFVSLKLSRYPKGAIVGSPDGEELALLEWRPEGSRPVMFPRIGALQIELDLPYGPCAWEAYPTIVLDGAVTEEIMTFANDLHLGFSAGFHEPYVDRCTIRFADAENAHFLEPGNRSAEAKDLLPYVMDDPAWEMLPMQELTPSFRLCAEDRMVQVIADDWNALLRQRPDDKGNGVLFSMIVAKVDDDWQIIR